MNIISADWAPTMDPRLYPFFTHNISVRLVEEFQALLQEGKTDFEARALLIERLDYIHRRLIPPLPPGEYLWLHDKITKAKPPFEAGQPPTGEVAPEPEAGPADEIDQAIKWLARKLKRDRKATFAKYRPECMEKFNISGIVYKAKVWPDARRLARLGKAKAGRPKKN